MAPEDARRHWAGRIRGFGTTIFAEMTELAVAHGAVNLGQGFPNFPCPDFLKEAARKALYEDQNQYARSAGPHTWSRSWQTSSPVSSRGTWTRSPRSP